MKYFIVLVIALHAGEIFCQRRRNEEWTAWKNKHGKHYSGAENEKRFKIWNANRKFVEQHNEKYSRGETTYDMDVNGLAAMTLEEFGAMLMPKTVGAVHPPANASAHALSLSSLPSSVDWNQKGYVTNVKDQGQLGSCYSFSAVEAVEGQYCKKTGHLKSFSEMQVVDCDQGGDGGFPFKVYQYIRRCGGLETEKDYPYVDKVGKCQFERSKAVARLRDYKFVRPFADEKALQDAVAQVGPISVSSIKVFSSFQFYKSGVYYESKCNGDSGGQGYHAMLATGYGTTSDKEDYWMVKNSWGTGWGENGYILMSRNRDNNCGIASQASYPIMSRVQREVFVQEDQETTTQGGSIPTTSALTLALPSMLLFTFRNSGY